MSNTKHCTFYHAEIKDAFDADYNKYNHCCCSNCNVICNSNPKIHSLLPDYKTDPAEEIASKIGKQIQEDLANLFNNEKNIFS